MDIPSVAIGALMVAFGLYGLVLYASGKAAEKFKKLTPMREMWGQKAGTAIHFGSYVILPVVAGLIFAVLGLSGQSIFDF